MEVLASRYKSAKSEGLYNLSALIMSNDRRISTMGLADRDYMRKEYQVGRRDQKRSTDFHADGKMPSYRIYKIRGFFLDIKDKLKRIIQKKKRNGVF